MGRTGRRVVAAALGALAIAGVWVATPSEAVIGVTLPSTTFVGGLTTPSLQVTVPTLPIPTTLPPLPVTVPPAVTDPTVTVTVPPVTVPNLPVTLPTSPLPSLPGVTVPTLPTVTVPSPGKVTGTVTGCAQFVTQQAAQLALAADPSLAALLDADHDGAACELLPSAPGGAAPSGANPSGPSSTGGSVATSGLASGTAASGATGAGGASTGATTDGRGSDGGSFAPTTGGSRRTSGPGGAKATGRPEITVAGDTVASTRPLGDAEGEDVGGRLALTILAFVLLLGSAAGTAREVAAGRAGDRPSAVA